MTIILSLDPSFAATGYVVLRRPKGGKMSLVTFDWIPTHKSRAARQSVTLDDMRRAQEIACRLITVINHYKPTVLCSEVPLGSQSAVASKGLAIVKGVVATLVQVYEVLPIYLNPFQVKKGVCGNKDATKEEVIQAVERVIPELKQNVYRKNRNGRFTPLHEAVCDAAAVAIAAEGK